MHFILTKTKCRIFVPECELKQGACPHMKINSLHENEFYVTKSQAFLFSFLDPAVLFIGKHKDSCHSYR